MSESESRLAGARQALRERQGAGARYDAPEAPARELAWARLGTAYFARALEETDDAELAEPSALPGWTRAELVAHVGYNARALTRLCTWARTGIETPMYASSEMREREIRRGGSLPPRALRHLAQHAAVHLDVEWRDLETEHWARRVVTAQGRSVPVRETAWMRAREVWVHAVDLGVGRFTELPADFLEALVEGVLATWQRKGVAPDLSLHLLDLGRRVTSGSGAVRVSGRAADLARWLTGRGTSGLELEEGVLPQLPVWL